MDIFRFLEKSGSKGKILSIKCIKIWKERFAAKNCKYYFIQNVFEAKNISLISIQSAEFYEFKIFIKKFQRPSQNWENSRSVFSAHEISLDAPIRINSESK